MLISSFFSMLVNRIPNSHIERSYYQFLDFFFINIFLCIYFFSPRNNSVTVTSNISAIGMSNTTLGILRPARVNSRPKKKLIFVPSNITSHYTCYCSILKAIFILAEERSATFSWHSKLCNHPSYLKNGSSVFHTISILSSPLIITF